MKKLVFTLILILMALTVAAQDHVVRRQTKPSQQSTTRTTVKPIPKPPSKPAPKTRPTSKRTNVSLCPDSNHPHMIDLGLPSGTKWACCNVDPDAAKQSPTNVGGYYAWGETMTKKVYDWSTYTHCDGKENTCHDIGECISGTQYDVAHVKWGGSWQMPTEEQQKELDRYCSYQSTTVNGVLGGLFTSKINGKSIFLPAGGYLEGTEMWDRGCNDVWTSKLNSGWTDRAINFTSGSVSGLYSHIDRYNGVPVRPVTK